MILTVDSSTKAASVALIDDGKIIYSSFLNDGRTHSQKLMPMVKECLNTTGINAMDMDAFAAIVGPGSFTGLRIGIAAIQGLAYTAKKQCIAISTLDALAYNCLLYTSPSPRDRQKSRMPSSA
jgi:tRNA threonylcarbamoyladenosine biosynthesis protein TsaB